MSAITTSALTDEKRFELVRWMIDNYDQRKAAVSSRAAILLSADALLMAATTFLIGRLGEESFGAAERLCLTIGVGLSLVLLVMSIALATGGMGNFWNTHQRRAMKPPSRLYFYPRQTLAHFVGASGFEKFAGSFYAGNGEGISIEDEALGHLWVIIGEYGERYGRLRWAVRLFVIGAVPLVTSALFILIKSL